MFSLKARFVRVSATLLVTSLLTLGAAVPALADSDTGNINGTSPVAPGDFVIAATTAANFGSIEINGTNQDPTATATIDIEDDTGAGAGWYVSFAATQFENAGGKKLEAGALSITNVTPAKNGTGTYTDPNSDVSYDSPMAAGTDTVTIFNAATGTGMGHFQLTPAFKVHIRADAYAGSYTSVFSLTLTSGPQ